MRSFQLKVFGLVQGVWFRKHTKEKALELGINGFVKNESDGSVYIEAEGDANILHKFTEWCHTGYPHSKVDKVEVTEQPMKNFKAFEIV